MSASLTTMLGVGERELISFVGAGGKTSLLLGVGAELVAGGGRVVLTTTTKMGSDQIPEWATVCRSESQVVALLLRDEPAFLVGKIDDEKITGVTPDLVERLFAGSTATHVLVEADGARRRSFKAPASHEPVIPGDTTLVVVVAGMDAVGAPIVEVAHRPERVAALLGRSVNDHLLPADIAFVLGHSDGGLRAVPPGAGVTVVLTKAKPGPAADAAAQVSALLAESGIDRVVIFDSIPGTGIATEGEWLQR